MAIDINSKGITTVKTGAPTATDSQSQRPTTPSAPAKLLAIDALKLAEKQVVSAEVKASTPVTGQLLERLMTLTKNASLPSLPGNIATPTAAPDLSNDIVPRQNLRLLELVIQGKTLLTVSPVPASVGDKLNLKFQGGQLVVLSPSARPAPQPSLQPHLPEQKGPVALTSHAPDTGGLKQQQTDPLTPATHATAAPKTRELLTTQHLSALQVALRRHLPSAENPLAVAQSLESAEIILSHINTPGLRTIATSLPQNIQEALKSVALHLRNVADLTEPKQLKAALQSSGIQMEAQLSSRINDLIQRHQSRTSTAHSPPTSPPALTPQAIAKLPSVQRLVEERMPNLDAKSALEQLVHLIKPLLTEPTSGRPLISKDQPYDTLQQLLRQLLGTPTTSSATANSKGKKDQLLSLLLQQATVALDKINQQQLQSLQRATATGELNPTAPLQLELPVRYGDQLSVIHFFVQEKREEQNEDNSGKRRSTISRWVVKLSFELPEAGTLYAHLYVQEDSVSANLWAENPETLKKAIQHSKVLKQRLTDDGINVQHIDCFAGKPVDENIQLNYSLIDVRT